MAVKECSMTHKYLESTYGNSVICHCSLLASQYLPFCIQILKHLHFINIHNDSCSMRCLAYWIASQTLIITSIYLRICISNLQHCCFTIKCLSNCIRRFQDLVVSVKKDKALISSLKLSP
jgi:hypothetical protein